MEGACDGVEGTCGGAAGVKREGGEGARGWRFEAQPGREGVAVMEDCATID